MTSIKLGKKSYELKLGYRELKRLESMNPGASLDEVLTKSLANPSLSSIEKIIYLLIKKPDFDEEEFEDKLDKAFEAEDLTFEDLMNAMNETIEESVFLNGMVANTEKTEKKAKSKAELKKAKAI